MIYRGDKVTEVIWKDAVGFEDYKVSSTGRIIRKGKTIQRSSNGDFYSPEEELTLSVDKDGYLKTALRKDSKRKFLRVHRIVAQAFIPNYSNLPVVNHINGIKDDNRVENLEWCTVSYNTQHAFDELGRKPNITTSRAVAMIDKKTGLVIEVFESIKDASIFVGVRITSVWRALQKDGATCKGYYWEYYEKGVTTIESEASKR